MNLLKRFKKLFDPIDLTEGKIVKVFTLFLIPIMLSMIFQQVYSLTDSIIVGQNLSENEIAGVNDAIPIAYLILNFTIGCTAGFSVILSKAIGEKDEKKSKESIFIQFVLSLILSIILTVASYFLINPLLAWVKIVPSETNTSMNQIYEAARIYLLILFVVGISAQFLYNMIVSILRAMGDSFTPFVFLVLSCILNIVLDLLFIVTFKWGVAGSAYATVISQGLAAIGAIIYAFVRYKSIRIHKEDMKINYAFTYEHLKMGIPLGIQWSIIFVGVVLMSAAVIPFDIIDGSTMVPGNPAQVGYGVSNKLSGLLMGFFSALGTGLLSFISQNYGAKKYGRIRNGFKVSIYMGIIISILCIAIGLLLTINAAYMHIFLYNSIITESSILYGNTYLYITLPFYFGLGIIYIGRNTIQALGKPLFPLLSGLWELVARLIVCTFLPSLVNGGPINSQASLASYMMVCFADPITWVISGLIVFIPSVYYIYKKFPKEDVIPLKRESEIISSTTPSKASI